MIEYVVVVGRRADERQRRPEKQSACIGEKTFNLVCKGSIEQYRLSCFIKKL